MRRDLLPLSILALACAVALHAVAPAIAQDAPPSATPAPAAAPAPGAAPAPAAAPVPVPAPVAPVGLPELEPECEQIRLGTTRELEKLMDRLAESGARQFMTVGTNLVCGW